MSKLDSSSHHGPMGLLSNELCPFAQRVAIMLFEKKLDFTITYIDLGDKPAWFLEISPLGKVPLLRIGNQVLFESAIINEYLDETHRPSLHPKDAIERAKQRAWIEFASGIFILHHQMIMANTESEVNEKKAECIKKFEQIEHEIHHAPYFNGA